MTWGILAFAVCVLLGYASGRIFDLSSFPYWVWVDVAAPFLGFGAIVLAAAEASRLLPRNTLGYKRARALNQLATLRAIVAGLRAEMCKVFQRQAHSPTNVAGDQEKWDAACKWIGPIAATLAPPAVKAEEIARTQKEQDADDFPDLDPDALRTTYPTIADDPVLTAGRDEVVEWVSTYKRLLEEYTKARSRLEPTGIEQLMVLLAPYLASLAAGLAVASALYKH